MLNEKDRCLTRSTDNTNCFYHNECRRRISAARSRNTAATKPLGRKRRRVDECCPERPIEDQFALVKAHEDAVNFEAQGNNLLSVGPDPLSLKNTISKVLYGKLSACEEDNKKVFMISSLCIYHSNFVIV